VLTLQWEGLILNESLFPFIVINSGIDISAG